MKNAALRLRIQRQSLRHKFQYHLPDVRPKAPMADPLRSQITTVIVIVEMANMELLRIQ